MKKVFIIMVVLNIAFTLTANAQRHDKFDFDKFKAEKISYITEAIELTPEEATKFWPIYNEFEKKKFEYMNQRRELENYLKENKKKLSDKELIDSINKLSSLPVKEGELNLEYNKEFLKILSPLKVVELYEAEEGFRRYLFKKFREQRNGDNPPPPDEKEK